MESKQKHAASSATKLKLTDDHLRENFYKVSIEFKMAFNQCFELLLDLASFEAKDGGWSWGTRLNL